MDKIENYYIVWKQGYKGFNYDWTDDESGKLYKVGQTYHINDDKTINLSERPPYSGFIFTPEFIQTQRFYDISQPRNYRYAIIEYDSGNGKVKYDEDMNMLTYNGTAATTSIRIVRELSENEISKLLKESGGPRVWRNERTKDIHTNDDRPAVINYYNNGNIFQKRWYKNNVLHRQNPDLPALIHYNYKNNQKVFQCYYQNGNYGRHSFLSSTDKPHCIFYDNKGNPTKYIYYENGEIVKIDNNPLLSDNKKYGALFMLGGIDAQIKYINS